MQVRVKVEPTEDPVTLEEAKSYLKILPSVTEDDQLIIRLIKAVTKQAQKYAQTSFVTQTLEVKADKWNPQEELPYGPHQSIISVVRTHYDNTETALTTDEYSTSGLNYLSVFPDKVWRLSEGFINNRITVEYVAGFGAAEDVPDDIKIAILKEVAELYENRENTLIGSIVADLSTTSKHLLNQYKRNVLI
jgi:uncharacterized phiE125 gp8 family phage protein